MEERDEKFLREEAAAAAEEAGEIGGDPGIEPGYKHDPDRPGIPRDEEMAPVYEAGGGYAEGFEQAEAMLEERATNPHGPSPMAHAGQVDEEAQAVEGADDLYAEPDHLGSPEVPEEERSD